MQVLEETRYGALVSTESITFFKRSSNPSKKKVLYSRSYPLDCVEPTAAVRSDYLNMWLLWEAKQNQNRTGPLQKLWTRYKQAFFICKYVSNLVEQFSLASGTQPMLLSRPQILWAIPKATSQRFIRCPMMYIDYLALNHYSHAKTHFLGPSTIN